MACGSCGSKTQEMYQNPDNKHEHVNFLNEEPTMSKKEILELASKVTDLFPQDITFTEVRQITAIVQQMYPPTPPAPPAQKV